MNDEIVKSNAVIAAQSITGLMTDPHPGISRLHEYRHRLLIVYQEPNE